MKKCYNCGKELPDNVGICEYCGSNVQYTHKYCPKCKASVLIDSRFCNQCGYDFAQVNKAQVQNNKKKNSPLSIVAAILALFTFTVFIGAIIGVIDLCINDKTKKHGGSWFAIIFCAAIFFIVFATKKSNNDKTTTKTTLQYTDDSQSVESDSLEFTYEKMYVKYLGYKVEKNATGDECLVLYFDFTNNSDKNQTFSHAFSVNAFQNGVELDGSYFHVNEETKNANKEILLGTTLKVAEQFIMPEDKSGILIEIKPLISFSDEKLLQFEIQIE